MQMQGRLEDAVDFRVGRDVDQIEIAAIGFEQDDPKVFVYAQGPVPGRQLLEMKRRVTGVCEELLDGLLSALADRLGQRGEGLFKSLR